jgi:hypothetical protein
MVPSCGRSVVNAYEPTYMKSIQIKAQCIYMVNTSCNPGSIVGDPTCCSSVVLNKYGGST